jgi:hypothetical protein
VEALGTRVIPSRVFRDQVEAAIGDDDR